MPAKKKTPTARRKNDKAEGHFIPDFRLDSLSAEAIGLARLAYSTQENRLDGYLKMSALLPDASPLKRVLDSFYRKTPIALEIPFFSFITYLSAWLTQKDIGIKVGGKKTLPNIWIVLLASSGGFKSFTDRIVAENAPISSNISDFESDAKMVEMLAENEKVGERHFWKCDEFAQTLKKIEADGSPLSGAKKYLLLAYDRAAISRKTKTYETKVEDTTMTVLGINVYDTFLDTVSPESLLDGFAQRFSYVVASDPTKEEKPRDPKSGKYFEIDEPQLLASTSFAWSEICSQTLLDCYELSEEAKKYLEEVSDEYGEDCPEVPPSFFIRLRYRLFSFSLLYHILSGKGEQEIIDTNSARYAGLLFATMLSYTKKILLDCQAGDLAKKLLRVEYLRDKKRSEGKTLTIRDVVMGMPGKVSASEARALLAIALGSEKP